MSVTADVWVGKLRDMPIRSVSQKVTSSRLLKLERMVKGFANHRRIQILELLAKEPELSLQEIAERLKIEMKTASEHLRRLAVAGLVMKRYEGREVRHANTARGNKVLEFLPKLV
jgi:DNA-binding transcriptional ArsR family regulator